MKIIYYNEYKRDVKKADKIIKTLKKLEKKWPYEYYIEAEVRVHLCPRKKIKDDTGYECEGLTYPKTDGSYDVYISVGPEGIFTAVHEMMHVVIFQSKRSGLFITEQLGIELSKEYLEGYDRSYAKTNWMEYICVSFEFYCGNAKWRAAHPKTCKFFEMRGFRR